MAKWQPIEAAPKDVPLLIWRGDRMEFGIWLPAGGFWYSGKNTPEKYQRETKPTHWLPCLGRQSKIIQL